LASEISRSIGEALPYDTTKRMVGTRLIVDPERHAAPVAEIELGDVAVQMLPAAVLIDAPHPALEEEKSPSRVLVWMARSSRFTCSASP
jgi:hypothetical protein